MEHVAFETEADEYDEFELSSDSQQKSENSEDLFCKPKVNDSEDCLAIPSTSSQSQEEKCRAIWLDKDCRLLIALYKEYHPNVGKHFDMNAKRNQWDRIAKEMNQQGSHFSASQVRSKYKSLRTRFNTVMENKKKGKKKITCPYQKEFMEIYLDKPSSPQLRSIAESAETNERVLMDTEESSSEGSDNPLQEVEISLEGLNESPRRSKETNRIVLEELKKLRAEFVKEQEAKKEYRLAKLNAYKKRTEVLEKQMKLRQDLLMAFKASQHRKT